MFGDSTTEAGKLIAAIRDQTQAVPTGLVFVIDIVSARFGGKFTAEIKAEFERYPFLQMLTLNDCGISSLENFPHIPGLIRLDLVMNEIKGEDLSNIKGSRHLQTLMLGGNKIEKLEHLDNLKGMKQLLQLDLIRNPVILEPGYRAHAFNIIPSLTVLDTLDHGGKDAYSNTNMMQAVSRVPDSLFDKTVPLPPVPITTTIHKVQKSKLVNALARTGSLDSAHGRSIPPLKTPSRNSSKPIIDPIASKAKVSRGGKKSKYTIASTSRTKSSKAGLVFPVGRIKRHLKEAMMGNRVSVGSSVYLSAALEYLSAELLEIAGNQAKSQKKTRITPLIMRSALKNDEQLNKMFKDVTIGMIGE